MSNLSLSIRKDRLGKDGLAPIRIVLSHNGTTRYIQTNYSVAPTQFKGGRVVKRADATYLNTMLAGILNDYQRSIDEVGYTDGLTCDELLTNIRIVMKAKVCSLQDVWEEFISVTDYKESSKKHAITSYKVVSRFVGPSTKMSSISYATFVGFENSLRKRNCKPATICSYQSLFRRLVKYAIDCGYVTYKINPLRQYHSPKAEIRDSWLTIDELRTVRDVKCRRVETDKARDIFMLSFFLGGINLADLVKLNFAECLASGRVKYQRTKTERMHKPNKYVEFGLCDEARALMEQLIAPDGYIALSDFAKRTRMGYALHNHFQRISERTGINNIIFYSARKTFAQQAFKLGVPTGVIDYILGHKIGDSKTSLYSYVCVTPEMATKNMRLVFDLLK